MTNSQFCLILYKEFGINAEYIIDHAWGREPATIASIKKYRPKNESINNSQVLFSDYEYEENKFPPNYRDVMSALDDLTAAAQKNALQQYTP